MDKENPSNAEHLEREYEDAIAHRYHRDYHEPPIMEWHSRSFVEYVGQHISPGDRVLDLGCASGVLWPLFREILPQDVKLTGVDLSPGMLEVARNNFPEGDFREGNFSEIPCDPGEFDVVIVSSAFHHINDNHLPTALAEIARVLDEHGILVGREPLATGRLIDRGGWFSGALMHLRHLAYRLTHTREYPEPDPGPDHHAYVAEEFLAEISNALTIVNVNFRNPISLLLARSKNAIAVTIAKHLDELINHRGGQEILYAARKNFSTAADVKDCVLKALNDNEVSQEELQKIMTHVMAASQLLEKKLKSEETKWKS